MKHSIQARTCPLRPEKPTQGFRRIVSRDGHFTGQGSPNSGSWPLLCISLSHFFGFRGDRRGKSCLNG